MGPMNWVAVLLGALAFFGVGALWYTVLFGKAWQQEVGLSDEQLKTGMNMGLIFALCLLAELLIATMLGHLFARTDPSDRAKMMMAIGFGAFVMSPAIGINYLYMRKSLKLFLIDAGHLIAGMAVMGGVFVLLG